MIASLRVAEVANLSVALTLVVPFAAWLLPAAVAWYKGRRLASAIGFVGPLIAGSLAYRFIDDFFFGDELSPVLVLGALSTGVFLVVGMVGALRPAKPDSAWAARAATGNPARVVGVGFAIVFVASVVIAAYLLSQS